MDRKKTILIAVMVNAGLLVVLFIAALSNPDEVPAAEIATAKGSAVNEPLFSSSSEPKLHPQGQTHLVQAVPIQEVIKPQHVEPKTPPITHKLPPPEIEKAPKHVPIFKETIAQESAEVIVKKGDSLAKIAKAHNTTVEKISKLNALSGSFLKIGQVLKLPNQKEEISKKAQAPIEQESTSPQYYTVQVGDNPWGIAMKHHMKMEELLRLNHLNEEKARKLKPGDHLRIR